MNPHVLDVGQTRCRYATQVFWCSRLESNQRRPRLQCGALPAELQEHFGGCAPGSNRQCPHGGRRLGCEPSLLELHGSSPCVAPTYRAARRPCPAQAAAVLVAQAGLEPAISCMSSRRPRPLDDRATSGSPGRNRTCSSTAYETDAVPLSYRTTKAASVLPLTPPVPGVEPGPLASMNLVGPGASSPRGRPSRARLASPSHRDRPTAWSAVWHPREESNLDLAVNSRRPYQLDDTGAWVLPVDSNHRRRVQGPPSYH